MIEDRFKFRVWDSVDKRYYDVAALGQDRTCLEGIGWVKNTDGLTFEQCTGLKDKNGRLIYENDLVEYFGAVGVVYWGTSSWLLNPYGKYSVLPTIDHSEVYEVIGNIHERIEK